MQAIARIFLGLAAFMPLAAAAATPERSPRFDLAAAIATAFDDAIYANGFETVTLTIDNRLAWCSVSQNGDPPSNLALTHTDYPQGVVVALHGEPATSEFVWGYWQGTDADAGANDYNQTASVTMSADKTVLACCPFAASPDTQCP